MKTELVFFRNGEMLTKVCYRLFTKTLKNQDPPCGDGHPMTPLTVGIDFHSIEKNLMEVYGSRQLNVIIYHLHVILSVEDILHYLLKV